MLSTLPRGAIPRNGGYRESFEILSPDSPIDPALYDFKVRFWPDAALGYLSCCDWWWSPCPYGLSADTDDAARLVFQPNDRGGLLTWSFPAAETRCLAPGSYAAAITVRLKADETDITQLATFRRVVIA